MIQERIVQYPNRRRVTKVTDPANTSDSFFADIIVEGEGTVTQPGTQITADLLNSFARKEELFNVEISNNQITATGDTINIVNQIMIKHPDGKLEYHARLEIANGNIITVTFATPFIQKYGMNSPFFQISFMQLGVALGNMVSVDLPPHIDRWRQVQILGARSGGGGYTVNLTATGFWK